jgi:hypothetical protein
VDAFVSDGEVAERSEMLVDVSVGVIIVVTLSVDSEVAAVVAGLLFDVPFPPVEESETQPAMVDPAARAMRNRRRFMCVCLLHYR